MTTLGIVATEPFYVVYDGVLLDDGTIPVRTLAPSLLALGELMEAVHEIANPGERPISLDIQASPEHGSFIIDLAVQQPDSLLGTVVSMFKSDEVTAAANLIQLISGASGLFAFVRWLKNRSVTPSNVNAGEIRLTTAEGDSMTVPNEVWQAAQSVSIRRHVEEVVQPLERDGIDELRIGSGGRRKVTTTEVTLTKADLPALAAPLPSVPTPEPGITSVRYVSVVAPNFHGGKWRVSENVGSSYWVTITDPAFQRRIDGREAFAKGDLLSVEMTTSYEVQEDGRLRAEYEVTRVVDHIARPEQGQLFGSRG